MKKKLAKFWWSGEIQLDVDDSYSRLMNLIEPGLNRLLADISFGEKAEQWAFIGIIRHEDSPDYDEVVRKSSRGRVLEFRIKIPHSDFLKGNQRDRIHLIFKALLRAVDQMGELGVSAATQDSLRENLGRAQQDTIRAISTQ